MSNTPDDYRRQHTAAAWDDLAAKRARELVTEWIPRAGKAASRSLLQWRNGWDKACFSFDSEPELDYNDVSVVPSGKRSLPISMELASLCLSTEETSATFICGDGDFLKVKLVPEVFHNIRAITSLTRLMGALKDCGTSTPPPDGHWELLESPTFRIDAAEALQLDASLITAAFRCSIFKRRPVDPDTVNFVLDASVEGIIEDTLSSSVPVDVSELDTLLLDTLGQPADGVTATSLPAIEPDSH